MSALDSRSPLHAPVAPAVASHPKVFWITGLSGSGKSTLAGLLNNWLIERGVRPIVLDGDVLRELTSGLFGYDRDSRFQSAGFNGRLCRMLANQGFSVICPTISLFHDIQIWNRTHIPGYVEIFLDVPISELVSRDSKEIYSKSQRGEISNVVGVDIEAQFPLQPDIRIEHHGTTSPLVALQQVIEFLTSTRHSSR